MPQMMPINWIMMSLVFIFIFLMFQIMNYYVFMKNYNKNKISSKNPSTINWKW